MSKGKPMTHWKAASAALISLGLFTQAAQAAAPLCTTQNELSALRTAALQQQLMVAGLTCHASDAYNRFVLAYRPELQRSDAELKDYFIRRGGEHGEADYDTFKTKLANLASLSDSADGRAYCANARVSFEMAMRDGQSLAGYVSGQQLVVALPEQRLCVADRQVLASANTSPAAGVKDEEVYVPRRSARPQFGSAPVQVPGVPAYNMPASPYQGSNDVVALAPPPPAAPAPAAYVPQPYDYYGDADAPPPPPPPPPRRRVYGAPAWPPGWGQYPYPPRRWYGYGY
jgi:hypothetical protein